MSAEPALPFAALLLAGGRSSRMGRDKAFLQWQGVPLWRWQLGRLAALRPARLLLSCRAEQGAAMADAPPGAEIILDPPDHDSGPLRILARALEMARLPVLALAVDMPLMPADEVVRLWALKEGPGLCFESARGLEPLAAMYVPAMLPLMRESLDTGSFGLQSVIKNAAREGLMQTVKAPGKESAWFANLNTPKEFAIISAELSERKAKEIHASGRP